MRHLFPWKQPTSLYDTDGPAERVVFKLFGAEMAVEPSGGPDAIHTGRGRFKVECLTCKELIHEATTGTGVHCEAHLQTEHDAPRPPRIGYTTVSK